MKRIFTSGLISAALLGVIGCSDGGMEEGVPKGELKPQFKMDPKFMDMGGRSFKDAKGAQAKAAEAGTAAPAAPAEEKK